jgi:hypothetical protein
MASENFTNSLFVLVAQKVQSPSAKNAAATISHFVLNSINLNLAGSVGAL